MTVTKDDKKRYEKLRDDYFRIHYKIETLESKKMDLFNKMIYIQNGNHKFKRYTKPGRI